MPELNKQETPQEAKKRVEKSFNNPVKNKLSLRCQRERMFVRPTLTKRSIKVS